MKVTKAILICGLVLTMSGLTSAAGLLSGEKKSVTSETKSVNRFEKKQLTFLLQPNEGSPVACEHELLSHVPWWRVQCGNRSYTVDVWLQVRHHKTQELTSVTLMYYASEGVESSSLPLVQFHSHYTDVVVEKLTDVRGLQSSIDVQNGVASLSVEVRPHN